MPSKVGLFFYLSELLFLRVYLAKHRNTVR